jgi:hypothetical protein
MTDKQYQQLFAAQLAQIALLQAIEANVSFIAHKHVPSDRIHPDWNKARDMLDAALQVLAAPGQ